MNFYAKLVLSGIVSFILVAIIMPLIIRVLRKKKMEQNILSYVEMHSIKNGTPTMGGIGFILAIIICSLIFVHRDNHLMLMSLIITFSYSLIGFLDDFIKFKMHRNLGLRPYQKIISQLSVAIAVSVFVYLNPNLVGSKIFIPFSSVMVDLKWGIIPFVILIFIATTNSVNLTDGLDGLASITTISYLFCFVLILIIEINRGLASSDLQIQGLAIVSVISIGALFGFLLYNSYPAKIFMGDTGSLGLGGLVASVSIFSRNSLYIPILGVVFVASSVSVIIQVLHFKRTHGKRVFLMAPLHHHFEKKGVSEVKIVSWYGIISLFLGLTSVLILMLATN
ncbi:MAG: phospho-N-acetylmuramoyl-pentapeptide-transferase [Clostridia bacterium]|nr:phospho-N-acetylmuramoyl-pentapeptide-transferase [Clostridia bacterium]